MAKARRCDRCGKFFMPEDFIKHFENDMTGYYLTNSIYHPSESNVYDLCIDCYSELKNWMESKKNENKGDNYES